MAPTSRPTAVAFPPADRLPPSSVASIVTSIRGRPSMITRWAPSPSGGMGQSGAQDGWMRVTCSTTMRGTPPTIPWTSNRTAPWVPASKSPIVFVLTVASSGAAVERLADLVELDAEGPGHQPHLAAPHHGGNGRRQHRRLEVHRLAHAHQEADRILLVVGGVIEYLLASDQSTWSPSPLTSSGSTSLPHPGSMPDTKSAPPPAARGRGPGRAPRVGRCAGRRAHRSPA